MPLILLPPLPTSATVGWHHITPTVTSYQTPSYSTFERVLTPPMTTHDSCQLQHTTYWPPFPKSGNSNFTIPSVPVYVMVIYILHVYSHIHHSSSMIHCHYKPGESIAMMRTSRFAPGQYRWHLSKQLGHTAATLTNPSTDIISKHCPHR